MLDKRRQEYKTRRKYSILLVICFRTKHEKHTWHEKYVIVQNSTMYSLLLSTHITFKRNTLHWSESNVKKERDISDGRDRRDTLYKVCYVPMLKVHSEIINS